MLFITRDKIRLSSPQHTPVTGTACDHSAACDPFRHRCLNRHWCGSPRSCTVGTRRWQRRQQGSATPLRHPPHLATRLPHYRCSVECFGHEDLWHRNRATSPSCNPHNSPPVDGLLHIASSPRHHQAATHHHEFRTPSPVTNAFLSIFVATCF
jgi:hypothetical protein